MRSYESPGREARRQVQSQALVPLARLERAAAGLEDTALCEGPGSPDFTSGITASS